MAIQMLDKRSKEVCSAIIQNERPPTIEFLWKFGMKKQDTKKLTCHCGAIELELVLPNGLEKLRRCNCSICSRKNAVVASVPLENLRIVKGHKDLSKYTFNTHQAKHFFCSKCGIYTHHQRRSVPTEYGFNISCLEGINIEDYSNVSYFDGKNNHPKDT